MYTLRIGLMGCGLVALSAHVKNLTRIPGAALAAAYDADPRRRQRIKELAPVPVYKEAAAFLAGPIDAVLIAVPYAEHAAATAAALGAGKHVYVEKPFALTFTDGQAMEAAWRRAGVTAMVGFNYRYHPLISQLRSAIAAGRIGELFSIRTAFSFSPHGGLDWDITRHGQHGALFDLAPHHLDLARYLTGSEVASIFASLRSLRSPHDTAHVQLCLKNGVQMQSCFQLNTIEEHRLEAYGSNGKLVVDLIQSAEVEYFALKASRFGAMHHRVKQLAAPLRAPGYLLEKLRSPWHEPSFLRALAAFVQAIRTGEQVAPTFADGLRNQELIDAAARSAQTGVAIHLFP